MIRGLTPTLLPFWPEAKCKPEKKARKRNSAGVGFFGLPGCRSELPFLLEYGITCAYYSRARGLPSHRIGNFLVIGQYLCNEIYLTVKEVSRIDWLTHYVWQAAKCQYRSGSRPRRKMYKR